MTAPPTNLLERCSASNESLPSDVTLDRIRAFTFEQLWPLRGAITERTALAHDFGVAGLDGKAFMEAYAVRFNVDLADFDWVKCFGAEGGGDPFGLFGYLYKRLIRGIPARQLVDLPEITLGHLMVCAKLGRWRAPIEG